jgi:hypothetical protein
MLFVVVLVVGGRPRPTADLPAMGLSACRNNLDTRCMVSWQTYAQPANTDLITSAFEGTTGFNGQKRRRQDIICYNPLSGSDDAGTTGEINNFARNDGTLVPTDTSLSDANLVQGEVGALCRDNFLMIAGRDDKLPELGPYVLPGNNYHVYDYALFWGNIRADARGRVNAFKP